MEQSRLDRINELARKSRETELSPAEKEEQQKLRREYILAVRANLRGQLENISIVNPDGTVISVKERHDKIYKTEE